MTDALVLGFREWLMIGLAVAIIVDVAVWRAVALRLGDLPPTG